MGHTLATVTQSYQRFLAYLLPFRRALRKSDQIALQSLLDEANQHLPATGYAANLLPGIGFLLSLILEKHKQALRHEAEFEMLYRSLEGIELELAKIRAEMLMAKENQHVAQS